MTKSADEGVPPGMTIAGRFRIEETLGTGGMADVYSATDLAGNRKVALKLLKPEIAKDSDAVERLRREGEVLKSLQHPAIVSLETFGKLEDGTLFIAMELLDGETLGTKMRRDGRHEPAELAPIVAGACAGLAAAHDKGIVHRDLKPDNIFLVPTDDGVQVKLLDFGISKVTGSDKLTQTGEVLGTPRYMAPEQLSAERDLDGRTDVYALGVIIYEALANHPPFLAATASDLIIAILNGKAAPLSSFRPDLDPEYEVVVSRCLSKARDARYGSARELGEAFVGLALRGKTKSSGASGEEREGMSTVALGSMGEAEAHERKSEVSRPDARPGTFSALGAVDAAAIPAPAVDEARAREPRSAADARAALADTAPAVDAAPKPIERTRAVEPTPVDGGPTQGATPGNVVPVDGGSTVGAKPATLPEARVVPAAPAAAGAVAQAPPQQTPQPQAQPADASAISMYSGDYQLPTRKGRTWLIVGGLVAGGITAALAIFAMRYFLSSEDASAEEPPSETIEMAPIDEDEGSGEPSAPTPLPAPAPESPVEPAEPAGAVDPTADPASEIASAMHHRPTGSRTSRRTTMTAPAPTPAPTPAMGGSALELIREARRANAGGDPRRCIELLDRAIDVGAPTIALKLRGDCLRAAGNNPAALRAYQRFCFLAPDHPAISEVRAIVEGLGGVCR